MSLLKYPIVLILLFIFPEMSSAQSDRFSMVSTQYGFEDGLVDESVFQMAYDGNAFTWLITQSNLVRFDGTSFESYQLTYKGKSIEENLEQRFLFDGNHQLWLAIFDLPVLGFYHKISGQFEWAKPELSENYPKVKDVSLIEIKSANELFIAVEFENERDEELMIFNTETFKAFPITNKENGSELPSENIKNYLISFLKFEHPTHRIDDDTHLIGGKGELFLIENSSWESLSLSESLKEENIISFAEYEYEDDSYLIATEKGLSILQLSSKKITLLKLNSELDEAMPQLVYSDENGNVWITTNKGTWLKTSDELEHITQKEIFAELKDVMLLPAFETDDEIWFINAVSPDAFFYGTLGLTKYQKSTGEISIYDGSEGLVSSTDEIVNVIRTRDNTKIVAYSRSGIQTYASELQKFDYHFTRFSTKENPESHISHGLLSPDSLLLASTFDGTILAKELHRGTEKELIQLSPSSTAQTENNPIIYWRLEDENTLLVATRFGGAYQLTIDPKSLQVTSKHNFDSDDWGGGKIMSFLNRDENGDLLAATENGIIRIDATTLNVERIAGADDPADEFADYFSSKYHVMSDGTYWFSQSLRPGIRSYHPETNNWNLYNGKEGDSLEVWSVSDMAEAKNGELYAATMIGVLRFDEDLQKFVELDVPLKTTINTLIPGDNQTLWAATFGRGLIHLKQNGEIIREYNAGTGLPVNKIIGLQRGGEELWMNHPLGLSRLSLSSGETRNYYPKHGIPAAEGHDMSEIYVNEEGVLIPIWYGHGLTLVDPENIPVMENRSEPQISRISLEEGQPEFIENGSVIFPPDNRNVSIQFSSFHYIEPEETHFRYRMNADESWSDWSQNSTVRFFQLAPGNYQMEVQSKNADNQISPQNASLQITVLAPWYQTSLAMFMYLFLGLVAIYFSSRKFVAYRTQRNYERLQAEQAEELAKLDVMKTNLLINISHELRTPLTLVLSPIEQLREQAEALKPEIKRKLDIARRNGKRLHQLVEQVLDLTRLDSRKMDLEIKEIELTSFVKRTTEAFESLAERSQITIKTDIPDNPILFFGDEDKLEKMLVNVIGNAIKFTPEKGSVTVALREEKGDIKLSVTDTGRGIQPDHVDKIFDRFHSTSEKISGGGTGLGVGLSITKQFADLHEGNIDVESEPGKGSTFTITLPKKRYEEQVIVRDEKISEVSDSVEEKISEAEKEKVKSPLRSMIEASKQKETVLVVEDNEDMRAYIRDVLEKELLQVETAENGNDARKKLINLKPDIIITDIMMPEMDGFEFVEFLRSVPEYRKTPVIVLSARAEVEDRIHGYQIGVSDYLVKPFNAQELQARIANLLMLKREREIIQEEIENSEQNKDGDSSSSSTKEEIYSEDVALIEKLKTYVQENVSQSTITAEDLSEAAGMSRRQLYRRLKESTGFTAADFVREIKMLEALKMIEQKKTKTVSEVAYAVGFSTPSHFSRVFKSRFGKSPGEYI